MDSDLAESVAALKDIFARRKIAASFGKAQPDVVEQLRKSLRVPARYRAFLLAADPIDVETVTPIERVRLFSSDKLAAEQLNVKGDGTPEIPGWRKTFIIIARSALLGDPYFLDISKLDAEGDCPVYTCMLGTDSLKPELCASSSWLPMPSMVSPYPGGCENRPTPPFTSKDGVSVQRVTRRGSKVTSSVSSK